MVRLVVFTFTVQCVLTTSALLEKKIGWRGTTTGLWLP